MKMTGNGYWQWLPKFLMYGVFLLPVLASAKDYDATLKWSQRAELGAVVNGIIEKVMVNPGAQVKKGEALIQIDASVYRASMNKAKARVKSAKDNYDEAQRERDRMQELYDRRLLSEHDLQVAVNKFVAAEAELANARAELVKRKFDYKYSTIRAPFNAIVLKRNVQPGEVISTQYAQAPLLVIAASDKMMARFSVNETDLATLNKGQAATVNVGSQSYDGKITAIGLEPSEKTNSYPVDIEFNTGDRVLRAGLSAKVNL